MVKKIIIALVCLVAGNTYAQNGTVSPYSYFGIGDSRTTSSVENQMMGGLSMYGDSIHISFKNPAAFGKLGLMTYTAALSRKEIGLKSSTEKQSSSITNLDYLAIGFPLAKGLGVGFGLMPYSSVGYGIVIESLNQNQETIFNSYSGEGGLNRAFLSLGYQATKDISIGATANFSFGTISSQRVQSEDDVQFGTLDERESRINGFDFNISANYTPKISDRHTLYTSLGIDTQVNLVSKNSQRIGSFSTVNGQDIEVLDVNLAAQNLLNTEIKIPTTTTLGVGFGEERKWFLGGEYSFQALDGFSSAFFEQDNLQYKDASGFAIGGFFIPEYNSFDKFFRRVTYRAGAKYSKTGMVVNNEEINNFGITFGLGLPMGRTFSNINLGFELGKRGTTNANLVRENYFKINIGLSLNDRWFQKRQID